MGRSRSTFPVTEKCMFRSECAIAAFSTLASSTGTVEMMVAESVKDDATIPCHETLDGGNSVCRGFFDRHKTGPLQIAEPLGFIEWT